MFGGTGDDTLLSGGGDDFLSGDEGADTLDSGSGNDTLLGGSGNDKLLGGDGDDTLSGGDGDDEFIGGGGNDRIDGGSDNSASGSAGDVARFSGQRSQYSVVLGSEGIDVYDNRLIAPDGVDRLMGIENIVFSDLTMTFDSSISGLVVTGTPGDDNGLSGNPSKLIGTQLDDRILGLNGNDVLIGGAGADILVGGFGADIFEASLSDIDGDLIEDFSAGDFVIAPASAGGTLISLVNTGAPTATASSITVSPGTSTPLRSLFSWSDPDGVADILEFSVADQSVGGGYLTLDGSPVTQDEGTTITNISLSQIDRWAFVSGADGEFDNIGFAVTDSSGNTSDATVAYVESDEAPVVLESASEELEYFARVLSYDDRLATTDKSLIDVPFGYAISEVFIDGTFQAVGLTSENKAPLAIRGTEPGLYDWLESADLNGVGYQEFINAWKNTDLRNWLESHPDTSITGHSQGGAQAQLLASEATADGITLGKIVTFNSPGIEDRFADRFNPTLVDSVKHWITSGDLVQLAGDTFIQGDISRYNFDAFVDSDHSEILNVFLLPLNSHTNHWSSEAIYSSPYRDHETFAKFNEFSKSLQFLIFL